MTPDELLNGLFDTWFVLGFFGAIVVIPSTAVGLLLLSGFPNYNRTHPAVRRVLWGLLLCFSALALSLGLFILYNVE